jgi:hypothetical protein
MKIVTLRNALVKLLWEHLGVPVILSDQVQPEAELPYCIYTVTTPYASAGELGEYSSTDAEDGGLLEHRREMPSATFSFTFCSENRTDEHGEEISGADEAEELAESAAAYFLHVGYDDFLKLGITVVDVGQVGDRTTLDVDEAARRKGFDVRIRYTRTDTRHITTIQTAITHEKE